jgi:hypothetical protein
LKVNSELKQRIPILDDREIPFLNNIHHKHIFEILNKISFNSKNCFLSIKTNHQDFQAKD